MMATDLAFLYLGYAALLLAVVLLRPPAIVRAGFFAVAILAVISGGQDRPQQTVPADIVAAVD
jgi:hypothetical protein